MNNDNIRVYESPSGECYVYLRYSLLEEMEEINASLPNSIKAQFCGEELSKSWGFFATEEEIPVFAASRDWRVTEIGAVTRQEAHLITTLGASLIEVYKNISLASQLQQESQGYIRLA